MRTFETISLFSKGMHFAFQLYSSKELFIWNKFNNGISNLNFNKFKLQPYFSIVAHNLQF